ncbi:hypothetical protein ACL03H_13860 [Saccharopolyspora sp. MS10]|uniref:hypothetical protein n=1 Tax=Saccharopolyspora sp. MS10 TaxID=3385973 RepID=UPI0039A27ECB
MDASAPHLEDHRAPAVHRLGGGLVVVNVALAAIGETFDHGHDERALVVSAFCLTYALMRNPGGSPTASAVSVVELADRGWRARRLGLGHGDPSAGGVRGGHPRVRTTTTPLLVLIRPSSSGVNGLFVQSRGTNGPFTRARHLRCGSRF